MLYYIIRYIILYCMYMYMLCIICYTILCYVIRALGACRQLPPLPGPPGDGIAI